MAHTLLSVVLCIIIFSSWATWWSVLYPKFFSPLRKLPRAPGNPKLMGHGKAIFSEPSAAPMMAWGKTIPNNGLIRYLGIFNSERLLVTNPETMREILVKKPYQFTKPTYVRNYLMRLGGIGLLLSEGDHHKVQRKKLRPAFGFRHFENMHPMLWRISCDFVEALSQATATSSSIEFLDWAGRWSLDMISAAGLGQQVHAIRDPENQLAKHYKQITEPNRVAQLLSVLNVYLPDSIVQSRCLPFKGNLVLVEAVEFLQNACQKLIKQKQANMKGKEDDILSTAIRSGNFTNSDLMDHSRNIMSGGYESTATILTWAVYLLCQHQGVQDRLREEIHTHTGYAAKNSHIVVDSSQIDRLQYLHAVCNEVLRLYPSFPLFYRTNVADVTIGRRHIPKGTNFTLAPCIVNKSTALWGPDAEDFNPERWLDVGKSNAEGPRNIYAFSTFSHGPRNCPGQKLARQELACGLVALIGRFRIDMENKNEKVKVKGWVAARPADGLRVKLSSVDC